MVAHACGLRWDRRIAFAQKFQAKPGNTLRTYQKKELKRFLKLSTVQQVLTC
jgi:hypothetical protein